jgi:hypothetical protein
MMKKSELQEILNRINALAGFNTTNLNEYISLLKLSAEKIQSIHQEERTPMLDAWLSMGLQELKRELNVRIMNELPKMSPERQKTEFMYSRSTISMALTNILMHL